MLALAPAPELESKRTLYLHVHCQSRVPQLMLLAFPVAIQSNLSVLPEDNIIVSSGAGKAAPTLVPIKLLASLLY